MGKVVGDLQENVQITGDRISGALKKVTGYTGFSADDGEQSGNYLALHFNVGDFDSIKVELSGTSVEPIELDDDGLIVLRITNNNQTIRVVGTKGDEVTVKRYSLSNLTLNQT